MRDYGIDKGSIREFNTSARPKGIFKGIFGFRKMFWDYLNKLHVPFFDPCCEEATDTPTILPVGFDTASGEFVFWDENSQSYVTQAEWEATTTTTTTSTTTTSSSTTTTTTV